MGVIGPLGPKKVTMISTQADRPPKGVPQHSRSAIEIYEGSQAHDMNVSQPGTLCRSVLEVIQSAQAVF